MTNDQSFKRVGGWIQTYTGVQMWPLDPRVGEIDIFDIAHSLSMQCRFNGHTKSFYSVAEHCCHVSDMLPNEIKLAGLLHDASEAYLCDLPRPIKRSTGFAEAYVRAELNLEQVIAARFDFEYPYAAAIHDADYKMLGIEAAQLMAPLHPEWTEIDASIAGLKLECWGPSQARSKFLARFFALKANVLTS